MAATEERRYSEDEIKKLKRSIAREYGIPMPGTDNIRAAYRELVESGEIAPDERFSRALMRKKTRTLSGVCVVAVLTKPAPCNNDCLYCPGEKAMPKSYLSNEPAVMRAVALQFDPYQQVQKRLHSLEINGHDVSKAELIVMGGTFSHLPPRYQYWFCLSCYQAANDYPRRRKSAEENSMPLAELKLALSQEKQKNARALCRIVGLTLETRPDEIDIAELKRFRELGCTRVEIGVQSLDDAVLLKNRRGHGVSSVVSATHLLKEMGFKINYHIMPGLPGSSWRKDRQMMRLLFADSRFRPDMLKIYPCVVTKDAPLYKEWKKGAYRPLKNEELEKLIVEAKSEMPPYVRIARLIRDIPTNSIVAGPNIPNLRGILKEQGVSCRCIRCREAGRASEAGRSGSIRLDRIDYEASSGTEIFLQFIGGADACLHAFLRLRIPDFFLHKNQPPVSVLHGAAIIREVHSYGIVAPIGKKTAGSSQHRGYGKALIKKAAEIAGKEFGAFRLAVIAAEGTKEYYGKLGFRDEGLYMVKQINRSFTG